MKDTPSVEELQVLVNGLLAIVRERLGPRSTAMLVVGVPIAGSEHDRFAAHFFGPCLSSRGLLAWGEQEIRRMIDAQDTSKNGEPHP